MFSQRIGGFKQVKKKIGISSGRKKKGHAINDEVRDIAARAIAAAEIEAL